VVRLDPHGPVPGHQRGRIDDLEAARVEAAEGARRDPVRRQLDVVVAQAVAVMRAVQHVADVEVGQDLRALGDELAEVAVHAQVERVAGRIAAHLAEAEPRARPLLDDVLVEDPPPAVDAVQPAQRLGVGARPALLHARPVDAAEVGHLPVDQAGQHDQRGDARPAAEEQRGRDQRRRRRRDHDRPGSGQRAHAQARREVVRQEHDDDEHAHGQGGGEGDVAGARSRRFLREERVRAEAGQRGEHDGHVQLVAVGDPEQPEAGGVPDQRRQQREVAAEREGQVEQRGAEQVDPQAPIAQRREGEAAQADGQDRDPHVHLPVAAIRLDQPDEPPADGQPTLQRVAERAMGAQRMIREPHRRDDHDEQHRDHDPGGDGERDAEAARPGHQLRAIEPALGDRLGDRAVDPVREGEQEGVEEARRRAGGAGQVQGRGEGGGAAPAGALDEVVDRDPHQRHPHDRVDQVGRLVHLHRRTDDPRQPADDGGQAGRPPRSQVAVQGEPGDRVVGEHLELDQPPGGAAQHDAGAGEQPLHRVVDRRLRIADERVAAAVERVPPGEVALAQLVGEVGQVAPVALDRVPAEADVPRPDRAVEDRHGQRVQGRRPVPLGAPAQVGDDPGSEADGFGGGAAVGVWSIFAAHYEPPSAVGRSLTRPRWGSRRSDGPLTAAPAARRTGRRRRGASGRRRRRRRGSG